MNVTVNGEEYTFADRPSLLDVLERLDLEPRGIAIAVNDELVTSEEWPNYLVRNDDKLLIVTASQGG